MATKLKNLSVTSVDLVDKGANPDAHICLFKRKGQEPDNPDEGMIQKLIAWLKKGHEDAAGNHPQEPEIENTIQKEATYIMEMDKSKMTPEEQTVLEGLEKKYGIPDDKSGAGSEPGTAAPEGDVAKGAAPEIQASSPTSKKLHPEVQKVLSEYQELMKRQSAEVEELKKSLEIERLTAVAKKYEVLGKKADELAAKLYDLKKVGGTVYDDYVTLLDENVTMLTKSGLFSEIGKNTQGSAGVEETLGIKAAELAKSATGRLAGPDAIIKAWEENPELAAQYEAEYMGGR